MKRVLVTGANGLLGQKIIMGYAGDPQVALCATARGESRLNPSIFLHPHTEYHSLDIEKREDWEAVLDTFRPEVVIHAAAMTQVDACEQDPDRCRSLNVEAVALGIRACEERAIHFILLSTDFIFNGEDGPYDETATPRPLSVYGHSKWEAEKRVQKALCPWSIARTVLVVGYVEGLSRSNIILWAKSALEKGQVVNVVNDQVRTPTWAEDLAEGCMSLALRGEEGIFHLAGSETMDMYTLVMRVAEAYGLDSSLIHPVSSETLNQPAKRPSDTQFIIEKARSVLNYEPHSFSYILQTFQDVH